MSALVEADEKPVACNFRFGDMTVAFGGSGRFSQGIRFLMNDEVSPRQLEAGHTQSEWGYLSDDQVNERLVQHISRRKEIVFDWRDYPDLDDTPAQERWHHDDVNLWTLELGDDIRISAFAGRVSTTSEALSDRFEDISLYGSEPCFMSGEQLLSLSEDGQLAVFEQRAKMPWEGPARIRAMQEPVRAWLESQVRQLSRQMPAKRIGVLSVYVGWGFLYLSYDGMRSLPGIFGGRPCAR